MSDSPVFNGMLSDHLADTTPYPLGLTVERAEGIHLHLADGRTLMDLISGVGVSVWGHGHPEIRAAIHAQVDKHLHAMVYGEFRQSAQIQAAHNLLALMPEDLDAVYFVNSGAEAIEGAMKLARRVTGCGRFFGVQGGYHGNTAGALSISSNEARKAAFRPLLPEIGFLRWNNPRDLEAIDETVAGVVLETVQGDAGVRIPDRAWIQALEARCREVGALLILDEIQAGMGRTGRPFAFMHFDLKPDICVLGKALGGGMPIGAFVASAERMNLLSHQPKLGHITTFGGHPVACAASAVSTRLLAEVNWTEIERLGVLMESALRAMPHVREVRRLGYFVAVELDSAERVAKAVDRGLAAGLLIFYFLSVPHAFRLAPPLTLTEPELREAMQRLASVLQNC